jgi:pyruvate/2-oxoglutarate dehydrogenase complex dihydrolipoamide dehydrogenase (E3) component
VAHQARRAAEYGVGTGEVTVDFPVAIGRVPVASSPRCSSRWMTGSAAWTGSIYIHGTAKLRSDPAGDQHQVDRRDQVHTAPEVYLNVGARASQPRIAGLDSVSAMTEVELLALNELPAHLIVVAGVHRSGVRADVRPLRVRGHHHRGQRGGRTGGRGRRQDHSLTC